MYKKKISNSLLKYFFGIIILISVSNIVINFIPGFHADEPFTVSLIKHNFRQIIFIDSYDVHPPLYYLLLKSFLLITTFWTNSIIVKVIFARLFSFISFLITVYFLYKVVKLLDVKIHYKIQILLYILFPTIVYYSVDIRMYQLATMLLAIEIYGLLLFYNNRYLGLYISGFAVILLLYTNYFAAVFAGILMIVDLCNYLYNTNIKKALLIMIMGILDLILFIPYIRTLIHQVEYVSSNNYSNGSGNSVSAIFTQTLSVFTDKPISSKASLVLCVAFFILEILILVKILYKCTYQFKLVITKLILTFILGMLPVVIVSLISHPIIEWRYGYPLFAIIYFLIIIMTSNYLKKYSKYYLKNIAVIGLMFLIVILMAGRADKSLIHDDMNYNYAISQIRKRHRTSRFYINGKYSSKYTNVAIISSIYLPHNKIIGKKIYVSNILGMNNRSLLHKVFNNLYLSGKSN